MQIKVTYFDIEAVAEKLRLALCMTNTPFEDERVTFPDWQKMKPTVKYNQLPVLEVDGEKMYQSSAQLRFLGKLGDGSLYPQVGIHTVHRRFTCISIPCFREPRLMLAPAAPRTFEV
eukprot:3886717-Rhodomonas_salina.4